MAISEVQKHASSAIPELFHVDPLHAGSIIQSDLSTYGCLCNPGVQNNIDKLFLLLLLLLYIYLLLLLIIIITCVLIYNIYNTIHVHPWLSEVMQILIAQHFDAFAQHFSQAFGCGVAAVVHGGCGYFVTCRSAAPVKNNR